MESENKQKLSHREWRRDAKKLRRKKIRKKKAQERDAGAALEEQRKHKDPTYLTWLAEQRALELFQEEEDEHQRCDNHQKWLEREEAAQKHFHEMQEKLAKFQAERSKKNAIIRQEYKAEQERRLKLREEQNRIAEEKRRNHAILMEKISLYIEGQGDLPLELLEPAETNPDKVRCPFFSKTGACRFGDQCSRNHSRPNISHIILIPNFFTHILLEQYRGTEYGSDASLEYDEREMEKDFRDFYEDVVPEFKLFGDIVNFFVCRNKEPHLRGNVYVEYRSRRNAMKVYQKFQGRFYGGKQLNVGFRTIDSWSTAICGILRPIGLSFVRKCPKGSNCSFLHIFRNPGTKFVYSWRKDQSQRRSNAQEEERSKRENSKSSWNDEEDTKKRSWKWSESSGSDSPDSTINNSKRKKRKELKSRSKSKECNSDSKKDKSIRKRKSHSHKKDKKSHKTSRSEVRKKSRSSSRSRYRK